MVIFTNEEFLEMIRVVDREIKMRRKGEEDEKPS